MQTITCPTERGRRAHTVTVYHSSSRPRLHSNWEPLLLGDPWGPPPRSSIPPCADSGRVNRADAFWQIHSKQRWCILSLLSFFTNPNSLPLKSHLYFYRIGKVEIVLRLAVLFFSKLSFYSLICSRFKSNGFSHQRKSPPTCSLVQRCGDFVQGFHEFPTSCL